MKELLTKAAKLAMEQSRNRERVIALNRKSDTEAGVTDEERAELTAAVDRLESHRTRDPRGRRGRSRRARRTGSRGGEGGRRRARSPRRASGTTWPSAPRSPNFIMAAISGRRIEGAEAEIRAALSMGDNEIPMAIMDVPHRERLAAERAETRAVTPSRRIGRRQHGDDPAIRLRAEHRVAARDRNPQRPDRDLQRPENFDRPVERRAESQGRRSPTRRPAR